MSDGSVKAGGSTGKWLLGFGAILLLDVIYELLTDVPPVWDMAYHQIQGWKYLEAWRAGDLLNRLSELSTYYPPLYYLQEAVVLALYSHNQFLPLLTNLAGLFLLGFCTFRLAEEFIGVRFGWIAGLLCLLLPLVTWCSRESLLDVSLSGWVAAAVLALFRSRWLQLRSWSLLFGVVVALGMLTKWTFVGFLVFPAAYALYATDDFKRSLSNLLDAGLLATPPMFVWYLPNLRNLAARFSATAVTGTILEQDPGVLSPMAWVYYPRCLLSYYLYLPLTVAFLIGWTLWWIRREPVGTSVGLLWWWFGGGLAVLTVLDAKDPRYVMPLVSPLVILLVLFWQRRTVVVWTMATIAGFQFLTVSFDFFGRPVKLAVQSLENDTDYINLSREWVFYQTHYFEVAGPAHKENWRFAEILEALPSGGASGCVPEMARFNPVTLQRAALLEGREQEFQRIGHTAESVDTLDSLSCIVGKTGVQGLSYLTSHNTVVYERLRQLEWPVVGEWSAPDGSLIRVWRNPRHR